eukprot:653352-Amphidinium_carterae.2
MQCSSLLVHAAPGAQKAIGAPRCDVPVTSTLRGAKLCSMNIQAGSYSSHAGRLNWPHKLTLLAMRAWQLSIFAALRRDPKR